MFTTLTNSANYRQTAIDRANGYRLIVSSVRGGANPLARWDEACLFYDDPDGNPVWQAEVRTEHYRRFAAHDEMVSAIEARIAGDPNSGVIEFRRDHCHYNNLNEGTN